MLKKSKYFTRLSNRCFHYTQGQSFSPKNREYFYFIDHKGQLFLDDAKIKNFTSCFKEKKFLKFFFTRLKCNDSGKYEKIFPFLSPCSAEMNFIRCDDLPIVFDKIIPERATETNSDRKVTRNLLTYAGRQLFYEFEPSSLFVEPESGRLYHPAPKKCGGVGLVASELAQEISDGFIFEKLESTSLSHAQPTHIVWNGVKIAMISDRNLIKSLHILKDHLP